MNLVDDLRAAGLVDRARDTADRRRVTVTVSEAGRTLFESLRADALDVQDEILAPLTARERSRLTSLLKRVHDHVRENAGD